ncbi:MAG: thioesterase family protein [Eubacterium sp.]|nr:thioesterase family protein [Eubacterium sp.]
MNIKQGMTNTLTETVTIERAARTLGSGSLMVYGTPAMLLLVEKTAVALLEGQLDPGMTSVGTNLNVDHVAASPIGCQVSCTVELTEIDRKRLVFSVEVRDPAGVIGRGTHERFIVDTDKFQKRTDEKLG